MRVNSFVPKLIPMNAVMRSDDMPVIDSKPCTVIGMRVAAGNATLVDARTDS